MLSKYNMYYEYNENLIIFNNFNKKIKKINIDDEIRYGLTNNCLQDKILINDKDFTCDSEIDEASKLLDFYNDAVHRKRLDVMIMASLDCNFDCAYCYEKKESRSIDEKFENAFCTFIEKKIADYTGIAIEWFGGEPLLAKGRVLDMSKKIKDICLRNKKSYVGSMTTNGFLLSFEVFKELVDNNTVFFQITIDGNEEWHNRYRPLRNGGQTYNTIIQNLISIKNQISPTKFFRIVVRNNYCKDNYLACKEFENIFVNLFGDDDRFCLYKHPICDWGGDNIAKMKRTLVHNADDVFFDVKNYQNDLFESIGGSSCIAAKENGYVITPDYEIFKCNHYMNLSKEKKDEIKIGILKGDGNVVIDNKKNRKWCEVDVCESCRECKYLPNCLKRCRFVALRPDDRCKARKKNEMLVKIKQYINKQDLGGKWLDTIDWN